MKLSADQFSELAASFEAKPSSTQHERRRAARMELQANVKITPVDSDKRLKPIMVNCCDFSARGIAILHTSPMQSGQQFIAELARKSGGVVELLCTVAHCVPASLNSFRIGAEFTFSIPTDHKHDPNEDALEMQRIRQSMLK